MQHQQVAGAGGSADTKVTWEDQQNINKFGRLNNRFHDLEEQEETNLIQQNEVQVTKRDYEYESYRIRLLSKLKPGDHIAAERRKGFYQHHGIFEGKTKYKNYPSVIHFQGPVTSLVKGCASWHCVSNCGYKQPKKGGPVFSCIDCFSHGDKTFKMQYQLNKDLLSDQDPNWNNLKPGKVIAGYCNKKFYLERYLNGELYGHSSVSKKKRSYYEFEDQVKFYEMSSERSSREVLDVARHSKFKPYSLGCNNCEHFAVFCKTGLCRSIQIENLAVPIICENGRRVCPFMAKDKSKVQIQTGQENLKQEEQGSLELIQAKDADEDEDEDEEKVLLKSLHTSKRRKISEGKGN